MSSIATGMHKNSNTVRGVIFIAADTMRARVMKLRNREIVVAVLVVLLLPIYIFNKFSESFLLEKNKEQTVTETMIAVLQSNDKVVSLPLEEYILGVVLQEMPAEFELEALKAQAVAARTYMLTKRNHQNADICTDPTCCQAYCEVSHYKGTKANLDKVQSAVRETSGQILTYEGQPIEATYFSCSGGRTEDAAAVWGSNVPYLQSVESPGEESSVNYISTKKFLATMFSFMIWMRFIVFGTIAMMKRISKLILSLISSLKMKMMTTIKDITKPFQSIPMTSALLLKCSMTADLNF